MSRLGPGRMDAITRPLAPRSRAFRAEAKFRPIVFAFGSGPPSPAQGVEVNRFFG